jgi:hypothetical protein
VHGIGAADRLHPAVRVFAHDRATAVAPLALAVIVGLAVLGGGRSASAQVVSTPAERFFRIEWQVERGDGRDVALVGHLNNHYLYRVQRVRLHAHVMDQAGQVTHDAFTAIDDVPAGGRVTFRLPLPAGGARYAVTVHAFEFGPRESP